MGSWAIEPSSRELTPLDAGEVASGRQSSGPPGLSPWLPQPQCSCPRRLRPVALSGIMMLPAPSRAYCSAASCGHPLPPERATASGRRSSRRPAADSSSRPPAGLGRGLPRGATATGGIPGGADLEESFLFPECVQGFGAGTDSPRPAAEAAAAAGRGGATAAAARGGEAAAEVTGRPAGTPDRVPALLSAGASPGRPAPSGKPISLVYSCGFQLPVSLDKVDTIYQKHMGHMLLKVPMGEERMAGFPPLVA